MNINKYYNLGKNILFPICRSITGRGIRKSLRIIQNEFPQLKIHHVNSGKKVFDWKVPPEWNIKNAYVLDYDDNKIIDFKKNNLHLVNYSIPVNKILKKREILNRLHVNKKIPNAIPYVTSYYKKYWGFCCTYYQKKK
jgi:aminopeptidase-like protein